MRASTDAKLSSKRPDGRQSRESRELCTLKPGAARRAFLTPLDPSGPYEMHYTIELSDATLVATIVVAPNDAGRTVEVEILDEELVIADEGRCYRVLLSGAIAAAAEDRDRNFDHLGCLVDWAAPTLQEHPERVADLTADTSTRSDPPLWEAELARLRAEQLEHVDQLEKLRKEQEVHESSEKSDHRLYRLELIRESAKVFAPAESDDDAQALWSAPLRSKSNLLGREERGVIEIVEVRRIFDGPAAETWLRHKPLPGDKSQCWSRTVCPNGKWRQTPLDDAAELQAGFFMESGLQLLTMSLERDPEASVALLECTRQFVERVGPVSLFSSSGAITDRALTAVVEWMTVRSSADANPALEVASRLVLARGTLTAVLRLAEYARSKPQILQQEALMLELRKIADVEGYEESAQELFLPIPGSLEELLSSWETNVFPSVAAAVGEDRHECLKTLTGMLQRGDTDEAQLLLRGRLAKDSLAVLHMPRREELMARQPAVAYKQGRDQVEQFAAACRTGGATATQALGFVLGQLNLLVNQIPADRTGTSVFRMPMCIDAGESSFRSLTALLHATFTEDGGWTEVNNTEARNVACMLLRLLNINLQALEAEHGRLADETGSKLHALLRNGLSCDPRQLPHCTDVCKLCAVVYSAGQSQFLRTPLERGETAQHLIDELLKQDDQSPCIERATVEPSPNSLVPMPLAGHVSVDTGTDGIIVWPSTPVGFVKGAQLVQERNYMQIELEPGFAALSKEDPQGLSTIRVGVVRSDCDVNMNHAAWSFNPLTGTATRTYGAEQPPTDGSSEHRVEWIHEEWWRSAGSVLAGDSMGLLFDTITGDLLAVKNGHVLGTVFEGLEGDFCFAVAALGVRMHIYSTAIDGADNKALSGLERGSSPSDACDDRPVVERVIASLMHSLSNPSSIASIAHSNGHMLTESIFKLLARTVDSWQGGAPVLGESKASNSATKEIDAWSWGKCHSSFRKSADGKIAARVSSDPDYAGVRGARSFCTETTTDVHEWTMAISQNSESTLYRQRHAHVCI
jgi:hypothetical protein